MRVLDDYQDEQIETMIKTAIKRAEDITNRQLGGVATFGLYLDSFPPCMSLPKAPLRSVKKVSYRTKDNTELELEADEWWTDSLSTPATIFFEIRTVSSLSDKPNSIMVEFEAGYEKIPTVFESWVKVKVLEEFYNLPPVERNTNIDSLLDSLRIIPI